MHGLADPNLAEPRRGPGDNPVLAIGWYMSWGILLGVPTLSAAAIAVTLLNGTNPIWMLLSFVLAIVFLHGSQCVLADEARLRRQYFELILRQRRGNASPPAKP